VAAWQDGAALSSADSLQSAAGGWERFRARRDDVLNVVD
jgi:hypothetical protein